MNIKRLHSQFKKESIAVKLAAYYLLFISLVALFSPLLSGESGLLPYQANSIDYQNMNSVGPFEHQELESLKYRHWLGTDELGRDLLAGMIEGTKTALSIGFGSMMLAFVIALFLGGIAGYFSKSPLTLPLSKFLAGFISLLTLLLYCFFVFPWAAYPSLAAKMMVLLISLLAAAGFYLILKQVFFFVKNRKIKVQLDFIIGRLIELLDSVPVLFLIIALSALFQQSMLSIILIIALVAWTGLARHTRAQVIKIKEFQYIESGSALGFSSFRILKNHILPNALAPILISLSFGISNAILFESTLSFLGLGLGADQVSWGSILASSRADYSAWWLAIFPGLTLFCTLLSLNTLGDRLSD